MWQSRKGHAVLQSSRDCWRPGILEVTSMSIPLQRFSERSQLLRCHTSSSPRTPGGRPPSPPQRPAVRLRCSPKPGFLLSGGWQAGLSLHRPSLGRVLRELLPQCPCESEESWQRVGLQRCCVQRPDELEENSEAGSPHLQMGKVRPRQDLFQVQDFSTRGAL